MGGKKEIYRDVWFFHGAPQMFVCVCVWCLTTLSAQIGYIMPQRYEVYHVGPGDNKTYHAIKQ